MNDIDLAKPNDITHSTDLGEVVRGAEEMAGTTQSKAMFLGFVPISILLGWFLPGSSHCHGVYSFGKPMGSM